MVEEIQPDLITPTGKRKGLTPSVASVYRALAEHEKKEVYPEAVAQAHADFADLQDTDGIPARAEPASDARTTRSRPKKRTSINGSRTRYSRAQRLSRQPRLLGATRSSSGGLWAYLGATPCRDGLSYE
ncbi:hypothetical protein [Streptomyces mirabilis]|uniref:hypothetical protein n=1 Tax=Streptomyces mirabilis TaxID=68239 RepID=UPI0033B742A3